MKIILENAAKAEDGIWEAQLPPHEAAMFGQPKTTLGPRSVLLVEDPEYEAASELLRVEAGSVVLLNLGTTQKALLIDATTKNLTRPVLREPDGPPGAGTEPMGPGDREFVSLVKRELNGHPREAALRILDEIRSRHPGDLQRGKRSNFKNTPDNFWYVIVQPRAQSLSITVRGRPSRFRPEKLTLKDDRPGYTRFTLKHPSEVDEAVRIIEQSKRK